MKVRTIFKIFKICSAAELVHVYIFELLYEKVSKDQPMFLV